MALKLERNRDKIFPGFRLNRPGNPRWNALQSQLARTTAKATETAEMTKHVINSFLACSVSFINEISQISRNYNISFDDLENCVKSDKRIGKFAYLKPGNAFSGGTLARDLNFLIREGEKYNTNYQLIKSINKSNNIHGKFLKKILYKNIRSKKTKILQVGLSYKKNTSTIRRSIPYNLFV